MRRWVETPGGVAAALNRYDRIYNDFDSPNEEMKLLNDLRSEFDKRTRVEMKAAIAIGEFLLKGSHVE